MNKEHYESFIQKLNFKLEQKEKCIAELEERQKELESALKEAFEFLSMSQTAQYAFYVKNKHLVKGSSDEN